MASTGVRLPMVEPGKNPMRGSGATGRGTEEYTKAPPADLLVGTLGKAFGVNGGYVTADVIDVNPTTPGLDEMLAKFDREHWQDEDEVRFIIAGHGLFHIHSTTGEVLAVEVEAGDLIRVPRGTLHWFNLCADRRIRAIRLFQDKAGWTPHYTENRIDEGL